MYKIMPTSVRPMPLEVTSKEFANEWRACWEDEQRDTSLLYQYAKPLFAHWEHMLVTAGSKKDISYITMCSLIDGRGIPATAAINYWTEVSEYGPSIQEELELIFFSQLRYTKYYPKAASPRMAEFVLARDFKQRLALNIYKQYKRQLDIPSSGHIFSVLTTVDKHPDHLLIQNLGLDQWESYLLDLIRGGLVTSDIVQITHIPRETFYYEEKAVWQQLKQTWSSAEE